MEKKVIGDVRDEESLLQFEHSPDSIHLEAFPDGSSHRQPPPYDIRPTIPLASLRTLRYMSLPIPLADRPTTSRSPRLGTAPLIILRDKHLSLVYFTYRTRSLYVCFILFHSQSRSSRLPGSPFLVLCTIEDRTLSLYTHVVLLGFSSLIINLDPPPRYFFLLSLRALHLSKNLQDSTTFLPA